MMQHATSRLENASTDIADINEWIARASQYCELDIGVIILDHCKLVSFCNEAAHALLGGVPLDEIVGKIPDGPCTSGAFKVALADSARPHLKVCTYPVRIADSFENGTVIVFAQVTADDDQASVCPDIQSRFKQIKNELHGYQTALEHHAIVATTNRAGKITFVNEQFCKISGYARGELIGQKHSIVNSGYHPRDFWTGMWKCIASGQAWHGEVCNRTKNGELYWVDTTIVPLRDHENRIRGYVSIRFDITQRKATEHALEEENRRRQTAEELLKDVIDSIPDGVAAFDPADKLVIFNQAYKDLYDKASWIIERGKTFEEIIRHAAQAGQFLTDDHNENALEAWLQKRLHEHRNPGRVTFQHLANGKWLQVQERKSRSGNIVGIRADVTELKRAEQIIKQQAELDPLTGLYNRAVLTERLDRLFANAERKRQAGAFAIVDLDHFKNINDTLGHDAGDQLLQILGDRLLSHVRKSDTVVRLGGDEFALILPNIVDEDRVSRFIERLTQRLVQPVRLGDKIIHPGFSIGIAFYPDGCATPKELLRNADIALYQAKAEGRGLHRLFGPGLLKKVVRRQEIADALREALSRGEIDIAFQPQVTALSAEHVGFEVLARWQHKGQTISPADFIPIAEETNLITALGQQVLEKALAFYAKMYRKGLNPGTLAVNVAASQLKQGDFPEVLRTLLAKYGVAPNLIEVEITENVLLDRSAHEAIRTLNTLKAMGVELALDDFGTGYASLSHLKRFKVDRLKIDRSFVQDILTDPEDAAIARAIVSLAHGLNMKVVAEGVETWQQLERLQTDGCDFIQGYLFGRPVGAVDTEHYLRSLRNATMKTA